MRPRRPVRGRQEVGRHRSRQEHWRKESIRTCEEMGTLIGTVLGAMSTARFPEKDLFAMRLGLEEAIVNAVKHGHHGEWMKPVRVSFQVGPGEVRAKICDQGAGFDPRHVPDPLAPENLEKPTGRGILFMHYYMTWIRYNRRGNCVTLCKQRSTGRLA